MSNIVVESLPKDWATSLWYFFHVLSNKIKPESFQLIRVELLEVLENICNNLRCNRCKEHAFEYLKDNNFLLIQNVDQLKLFFFNFHNNINSKINKELFSLENLESKYNEFKFYNILQNILIPDYVFKDEQIEFIDKLKTWFNNNIHHFNID